MEILVQKHLFKHRFLLLDKINEPDKNLYYDSSFYQYASRQSFEVFQ